MILEATALRVRPEVWKFCSMFLVSVMVFTFVTVLSQQNNPITGNVALITGATDEPLPGEEGSNPGFAECQSLPEDTSMETIYNCDAAGYKHCEDIIGNIFKFTPANDLMNPPCRLTLPPEEAGYDSNVYPRQWIGCADPRTVTIVRYNHEEEIWEPKGSVAEYAGEGETSGLTVTATVNKLSDYAIAKKTSDYLLPYEDPTTTPTCQQFSCLTNAENEDYNAKLFLATYTNPESSQIRASQDITLNACGMIKGCIAIVGDDPNAGRMCPPGIDPDGPATCTNSPIESNCCIPTRDNSCDKDCWKEQAKLEDGTLITDEEGNPVYSDSTDPDCLDIGEKDVLSGLRPEQYTHTDTISTIRGGNSWQSVEIDFVKDLGYPVVITKDIGFSVESSSTPSYVWFKDFTYVDTQGNEHKLYPQHQLGSDWLYGEEEDDNKKNFCDGCDSLDKNGENRPIGGYGPEVIGLDEQYEKIEKYSGDGLFEIDNDYKVDRSYWEYLFFHPYIWYQRGSRSDVFTIPNITVQKIKYLAVKDDDREDPEVTVTLNYYKTNSDSDKDGFGAETDCDDNNPSIKPMQNEPPGCDGVDNNCNKEFFVRIDPRVSKQYLGYGTTITWEGKGDDSHYWDNHHVMAPCDGFIKVTDARRIAYLELWELNKLESSTNEDALSYNVNNLFYRSPIREGKLWTDYQRVYSYYERDDLQQWSDEGGPPGACGNENSGSYCIVGSKDSCNLGPEPTDCNDVSVSGHNAWNRDGTEIGIEADDRARAIWESEFTGSYASGDIEINKGDIIWGTVLPDTTDDVNDGKISFEIWCYDEIQPDDTDIEEKKLYIDEGINCETEQQEQRIIHFCKSDFFDNGNRECFEGEKLCTTNPTQTDGGSCDYTTLNTQTPGKINYYVYVCPTDTQKPCYKYTESSFKVCAEKESCNPATNIDMDCDGLKPYATRAEDGTADTSKTLDPDCEGTCTQDECNPVEHKWCNLGQWDTNNYCQKCGSKDSSCGKACAEGERSCDGGCLPNACDVSDNKWCNSGYWDTTDYAAKCGKNDSESYAQVNDCTHRNGCDVNAHLKCFQETNRWSWGSGDIGTPYCNTACSLVDSSCNKPCTSGTCDVEAEKYCNNGIWETPDNYCAQCGAVDADCGVNICEEGTCDYGSHKICINKFWTQPPNYCAKCAQYELETGYCACTQAAGQEEAETSCTDNLDNDCDGVKDCADPDCPSDLPECACIEGSAQACGANIGLCNSGTQTCSSGAWGTCIGEVKPKTEVCNSFDDDCDGETDEGCGSCLAGEKRQCGIDRGSCSGGLQVCGETTGLWSTCSGPVYQTTATENCDGMDNNCNGEIDESCSCIEGSNQSCGINIGLCKPGLQTCAEGKWGECVGMKDKLPEVCNDGSDNDCDGLKDSADDSCSASASLSPTCYDAIQNQGEDSIDCGGPCPECTDVTCNDRQKNGDEEGMDCGGSKCPPCNGEKQKVECGDGDCNGDEDSGTCPEDCPPIAEKPVKEVSKGFPLTAVLVIVLMFGIIGLLVIAFLKSRKTGKTIQEVLKGMFIKSKPVQPSRQISSKPTTTAKSVQNQVFQQPSRPLTKKRSFEDEQLEKSFREASDIFKK